MRERSCSSMNPFSGCISSACLRVSLNSSSSLSASRWWPSNGHSIARMWTFTPSPTFPTEVFAPIVAKDAWMALLPRIYLPRRWVNSPQRTGAPTKASTLIPVRIVLVPVEDAPGELALLDVPANTVRFHLYVDRTAAPLAHRYRWEVQAFVAYGLHSHEKNSDTTTVPASHDNIGTALLLCMIVENTK